MLSRRAFSAVASLVLVSTVAACAGGQGGGQLGVGVVGTTGLTAALTHVADTANTRRQIMYDNTAELVALTGSSPSSTKGFGPLLGTGADFLGQLMRELPGETGINLLKENYAISAGYPPRIVTLFHGGQNASVVTSHLTGLGWKQDGGMLAHRGALSHLDGGNEDTVLYEINMPQVRLGGADVAVGGSRADLSQIGSPPGKTLASDPIVGALANCLGDVVAAQIYSGGYLGGKNPAGVAIGIRTPASDTATPRAAACVSWSNDAQATQFAKTVKDDLASGTDYYTAKAFWRILPDPSVTLIGGSQHIVEWQANTPGNAATIFQMMAELSLPGLPNCRGFESRLPPGALAHLKLNGCPYPLTRS